MPHKNHLGVVSTANPTEGRHSNAKRALNVLIMQEMGLQLFTGTTGCVCLASRGRTFTPFYQWFLHLVLKIVDWHLHVGPHIR